MTTTLLTRPARPALTSTPPVPRSATAPRPTPVTTTAPVLVLPADLPFHVLVARAQRAEREDLAVLWLTGAAAAAVASRLLRLTRTLAVGAELDLTRGAYAAALDAVVLGRIGGARAHVLVRSAGHLRALARELGRRPRARATRFGGDAFAAALPPLGRPVVEVVPVTACPGDAPAGTRALLVLASAAQRPAA